MEKFTVNLRNVRAIAGKEVYHLVRDFRSLYLAFAVPLLLILLFGYALSLDVENIETAVVDFEQTDSSRDFVRRLDASPYFRVAAHLPNSEAVKEALDHGRVTMAVIIPAGWSADLLADREAAIQILLTAAIRTSRESPGDMSPLSSKVSTGSSSSSFSTVRDWNRSGRRWRGGYGSGSTRTWKAGTSSYRGSSRSSS